MPDDLPGWELGLLRDSAAAMAYPETPNLVDAVKARLESPSLSGHRTRRVWAAAALAACLIVGALAIVAASERAREAVADFLGLAVQGEVIEVVPVASQTLGPPSTAGLDGLAKAVTLDEAVAALGFRPALAAGEPPRKVYLVDYEGFAAVAFDFGSYRLWQFRSSDGGLIKKLLGSSSAVEATRVGDRAAYWVKGGTRLVVAAGPDGREIAGTARTVSEPALLWSRDGIYYRIEGDVDLAEALRIAGSLVP